MNLVNLKERIATSPEYAPDERDFLLEAINEKAGAVTVEVQSPRNYLGRIDFIWMVLSVDDGGEGVVAAPFGTMTLPLVAADKQRLDEIIPIARELARLFGKPLRLARFSEREDIEIYRP
jgi:hypothetical protein